MSDPRLAQLSDSLRAVAAVFLFAHNAWNTSFEVTCSDTQVMLWWGRRDFHRDFKPLDSYACFEFELEQGGNLEFTESTAQAGCNHSTEIFYGTPELRLSLDFAEFVQRFSLP